MMEDFLKNKVKNSVDDEDSRKRGGISVILNLSSFRLFRLKILNTCSFDITSQGQQNCYFFEAFHTQETMSKRRHFRTKKRKEKKRRWDFLPTTLIRWGGRWHSQMSHNDCRLSSLCPFTHSSTVCAALSSYDIIQLWEDGKIKNKLHKTSQNIYKKFPFFAWFSIIWWCQTRFNVNEERITHPRQGSSHCCDVVSLEGEILRG